MPDLVSSADQERGGGSAHNHRGGACLCSVGATVSKNTTGNTQRHNGH